MQARWTRALFPAALAVTAAAVLGCAHGEAVESPDIVLGEDWPPGVSTGTGLPPWLPPMLRGQGGGPAPWLDDGPDPGDHADHEDELDATPPGDDDLLAQPPDEGERGHEDFL